MFERDEAISAYQQAAIHANAASANPHQLVLMLINGLLDELARAEGHLIARSLERKGQSIARCLEILGGLDSALNMAQGGALALDLHHLYDYCGQRLFEVSVSHQREGLSEVRRLIEELREGWETIGLQMA